MNAPTHKKAKAAACKHVKFQRALWPAKTPATAITPDQQLDAHALAHRLKNAIYHADASCTARAETILASLNCEVRRDNTHSPRLWFTDWRACAESECCALEAETYVHAAQVAAETVEDDRRDVMARAA